MSVRSELLGSNRFELINLINTKSKTVTLKSLKTLGDRFRFRPREIFEEIAPNNHIKNQANQFNPKSNR